MHLVKCKQVSTKKPTMPISSIVKKLCPKCNKILVEKSRFDIGVSRIITYTCGHSLAEEIKSSKDYELKSSDGKELRQYQIDGIKFAENSNFRCLIADEQGLGKTIQALGSIKLHPELMPVLIITKTSIKHQWLREIERWCGLNGYITQAIMSSKEIAMPGFNCYIISYDLCKNESIFSLVSPKTLIIDECQAIKNHLSERAKAVERLASKAEHIIALSGTPIKNNAGEYFTILNILQPSRFPSYQRYISTFCDSYDTQYGTKVGGINDPEYFKQLTSDFIIRRTRKEAAPEIPEVDRQFYHVELDKKLNSIYAQAQKELEEIYYTDEDENTMTSMIAIMTKMRRITGLSKVIECVDQVDEFLDNEPTRKLVIFAHHHSVVRLLEGKLNTLLSNRKLQPPLNLNASLDANRRNDLVSKFRDDPNARILIASTLAAGEGLNLQFCSRAIMLERQWNPANEEQAEGRFARIGQEDNIIVQYFIASQTIDEYFTELVEQKRAIVKGTLDGITVDWDSSSLMKELAGVLVSKGKHSWRLAL